LSGLITKAAALFTGFQSGNNAGIVLISYLFHLHSADQYSVAVCPPVHIVDAVREMKTELFNKIKWFHSKNTEAHITVNVFGAEENEVVTWEKYLAAFCGRQHALEIRLASTGFYETGAYYLALDEQSKQQMVTLMNRFHMEAPLHAAVTSFEPHISIGRQLKKIQLDVARQLFDEAQINLTFICDNLALRRFDKKKGQYEIIRRFNFDQPG